MIEFLLLDLDETILDFHKAEYYGIRKTLADFGIEPTEQICSRYSQINDAYWKRLERGEVTREQLLVGRFEELFRELGVSRDAAACSAQYMDNMSSTHYFLPGAEDAVKALSKKYRMFLVSNGTERAQRRRLESADLNRWFEKIFISQAVGVNKPDKLFFDRCFAQIEGFDPRRAIIVGDSLSSDIQGGINAGIRTCWVNPKKKAAGDIRPDHEIASIAELEALLETI